MKLPIRSLAVPVLAAALLLLRAPALAHAPFTLQASAAQTGAGNSGSTGTEIGNWSEVTVMVNVTAGSGTVNPFRVWIETSPDSGATWYEAGCKWILKAGAAAPGAVSTNQRDIVNETAVVTSQKYWAICELHASTVRAAWNISGSTPSETFSVTLLGK